MQNWFGARTNRFLKHERAIKNNHEDISTIIGKRKKKKKIGKGKRKNSGYLPCSTIGRMKKCEKISCGGITHY
jgi:hypothetical protein